MQYVIVGTLLLFIIACSGWLIYFYNSLTNSNAKVDEAWKQVNRLVEQRALLMREYRLSSTLTGYNSRELANRLSEIDEKIAVHRSTYNDAVRVHNRFIRLFPHSIAASIIGTKNLPYLQEDEITEMISFFHSEGNTRDDYARWSRQQASLPNEPHIAKISTEGE
ncbi:MAG: LemA family protein [Bacillota bacterium]